MSHHWRWRYWDTTPINVTNQGPCGESRDSSWFRVTWIRQFEHFGVLDSSPKLVWELWLKINAPSQNEINERNLYRVKNALDGKHHQFLLGSTSCDWQATNIFRVYYQFRAICNTRNIPGSFFHIWCQDMKITTPWCLSCFFFYL